MSKPLQKIEPSLNIPRRDVLEARVRSLLKKLGTLHEEYELERADLETTLAQVEMQMQWQGYSQNRKELIARVLELPDAPGVYEIFVDAKVHYVGESQSIRNRAIDHLQEMWNVGTGDISPTLYRTLATVSPSQITFDVVHIGIPDKRQRLSLEAAHIRRRTSEGHPLANIATVFGGSIVPLAHKPKRASAKRRIFVEDEEQWERLLDLMSEELRDAHYMRRF